MVAATKKDSTENVATEVAKWSGFTTEELKALQSFEDIEKLLAEKEIEVHSASEEMGDGFALLDNKAELADKPLMFVSWSFAPGDFQEEFVAARVMCRLSNGTTGKYVIIDGGTGIRKQLREYTDAHGGKQGGLFVAKGLRESTYDYVDEKGETSKATTWYVNTSA